MRVNGVRLGAEPTPVLHGDKIQIGGHELLVVDAGRVGSTQMFDSRRPGRPRPLAPPSRQRRPARPGGRLVCLTDGREYTIAASRLVFGRDAGAMWSS